MGNQMKLLFLSAISLALSACGPGDGAIGDQPTISGQLEGWNRGAAFTLEASVLRTAPTTESIRIASAPIDAAGNFSITLPGSATMLPLLTPYRPPPAGCTGTLEASPAEFASTLLHLNAVSGSTKLLVSWGALETVAAGLPQHTVSLGYYDRDVRTTGRLTCTTLGRPSTESTVDTFYRSGWNRVNTSWSIGSNSSTVNSSTTGPVPDGSLWIAQ